MKTLFRAALYLGWVGLVACGGAAEPEPADAPAEKEEAQLASDEDNALSFVDTTPEVESLDAAFAAHKRIPLLRWVTSILARGTDATAYALSVRSWFHMPGLLNPGDAHVYVVRGSARVQVEDQVHDLNAGGYAFVPRHASLRITSLGAHPAGLAYVRARGEQVTEERDAAFAEIPAVLAANPLPAGYPAFPILVAEGETSDAQALWLQGLPPHYRQVPDEYIFVWQGEVQFSSTAVNLTAAAGDFLFIPKRYIHSVAAVGAAAGGLIVAAPKTTPDDFIFDLTP